MKKLNYYKEIMDSPIAKQWHDSARCKLESKKRHII